MGVPSERGKASAIVMDGRLRNVPGFGVTDGRFLDSFPLMLYAVDVPLDAATGVPLGTIPFPAEIVYAAFDVQADPGANVVMSLGVPGTAAKYGTHQIDNGTTGLDEVDVSALTTTDVGKGDTIEVVSDAGGGIVVAHLVLIVVPRLG